MRIALVHDDLVQWGGAEKVLLAMSEMFPEAPIYTSVFDQSNPLIAEKFKNKKIITSFLQKIPGWKNMYRPMLPLYPLAFESFDLSQFDVVISQTTKFAKAIVTKPETIHICYTHTPPRFLWDLPSDTYSHILKPLFKWLKICDLIFVKRVDYFVAGSYNCQERLKKIYQIDSKVLQPFVDERLSRLAESFDGGYYLMVARLNEYKNAELVVKTFNQNKKPLKIVGSGPQKEKLIRMAKNNIQFYEKVSDQLLASLFAGSKGLIVAAEEDFGMTALEAQIFGKGVIAFGKGGSLETVIDGKTGVYFMEQTIGSLQGAIEKFEQMEIDPEDCKRNAEKFSLINFQKKFNDILESILKKPSFP